MAGRYANDGHYHNLTEEQRECLDELRENLEDVLEERHTDWLLLRYLRARAFRVDAAETMLRNTLEFRKTWKVDTILDDYEPPELLKKYGTGGFLNGLDNDGHPVAVEALGQLDFMGLMKSLPREEIIRSHLWKRETEQKFLRDMGLQKDGSFVETITAIIDVQGLNRRHLWAPGIKLFNELMEIDKYHYPEFLHRVLIVRAPRIFPIIYALVKPVLDPVTREKIEIFGSNWQEALARYVDKANMPDFYGGTATDTGTVNWGGMVPLECYRGAGEEYTKVYIKAGKKYDVSVLVEKVESVVNWEFATEDHDLGFSLQYKETEDSEMEAIIENKRLSSHENMLEGEHVVQKVGHYVLLWDNTFSWTRGKNLSFRYEVIPPPEPEPVPEPEVKERKKKKKSKKPKDPAA